MSNVLVLTLENQITLVCKDTCKMSNVLVLTLENQITEQD